MSRMLVLITTVLTITQVAGADSYSVKNGRAADPKLKSKTSGVPTLDLTKVPMTKSGIRKIPVLDLGEESVISANLRIPSSTSVDTATWQIPLLKSLNLPKVSQKSSPLTALPKAKIQASELKAPTPDETQSSKTSVGTVPELAEAPEIQTAVVKTFSEAEQELLRSLILMDIKGQHLVAYSHLANLKDSGAAPQDLISYHYARAAWNVGLRVESRAVHKDIMEGKNSNLRKLAAGFLISTAQKGEYDLVPDIEKLRNEDSSTALTPQYLINLGLHYDKNGEIGRALEFLDQVPEKSEQHPTALFLKSIISYRSGNISDARSGLQSVLSKVENSEETTQLRSSAALTLARIQFQLGQYKEALASFRSVHKSHPEWPQAMIEQSWAQILSEDFEGAAGNMFTLHTDFFKNMFAPESYVVRTVGYLNLCQYGDGLRTLGDLTKRYTDLKSFMAKLNLKEENEQYYIGEIKRLFNDGGKTNDLPKMLVVEMARSQDFRYYQAKLNAVEDESTAFGKVVLDLIALEKETTASINNTLDQIKLLKGKQSQDASVIASEEVKLTQLKGALKSLKEARKSVKSLQGKASKTYAGLKGNYRVQAERSLIAKLKEMRTSLDYVLDQSEVLQYELFAGASQHLREEFKAEGKKPGANPESAAGDGKRVKWSFKGEIWEDELGHFRSSLKDVCTESDESKQAQLSR